jgi:hypothetical protein
MGGERGLSPTTEEKDNPLRSQPSSLTLRPRKSICIRSTHRHRARMRLLRIKVTLFQNSSFKSQTASSSTCPQALDRQTTLQCKKKGLNPLHLKATEVRLLILTEEVIPSTLKKKTLRIDTLYKRRKISLKGNMVTKDLILPRGILLNLRQNARICFTKRGKGVPKETVLVRTNPGRIQII